VECNCVRTIEHARAGPGRVGAEQRRAQRRVQHGERGLRDIAERGPGAASPQPARPSTARIITITRRTAREIAPDPWQRALRMRLSVSRSAMASTRTEPPAPPLEPVRDVGQHQHQHEGAGEVERILRRWCWSV
jgi:hypothetical protein